MASIKAGPVPQGKAVRLTSTQSSQADTLELMMSVEADAALISLWVTSIIGSLDVSIYTQTDEGKDFLLASFPTVSSPSINLELKKAVEIISQLKIVATWTGPANFELYGRGISAAASSVAILGAATASATQMSIPSSPTLIIPTALTDRSGLVLKNNGGAILYIGFTALQANSFTGYPISPGESLAMDLSPSAELWGLAAMGTLDIRLLQAGS